MTAGRRRPARSASAARLPLAASAARLPVAALAWLLLVVAGCGAPEVTPVPAPGSPGAPSVTASPSSVGPQESATPAGPATSEPSSTVGATATPASAEVGVALPSGTSGQWAAAGEALVDALGGLGYEADLRYAGDDPGTQASQVAAMIDGGARILVVAPVDGPSLAGELSRAAAAEIPILAFDRLAPGFASAHIDAYVGFDRSRIGILQGTSIEQALDIKGGSGKRGDRPFRVELIAGPAGDPDAAALLQGALSVLQPYLDAGLLVVPSRQVSLDEVGTPGWDPAASAARLDGLLATRYAKKRLDAVLSPTDGISAAVLASLRAAGHEPADGSGPVVTGFGAELAAVRSIARGEQASTVFADPRQLGEQAAVMVDQLLRGQPVDANVRLSVEDGRRTVPGFLLDAVLVTRGSIGAELVDTGFYTAEQVAP